MTDGVMMQMGGFQFSISTAAHEKLRRVGTFRWKSQPRLQTRPQKQKIGIGDETLSLEGTIYPSYDRGGRAVGIYQVDVIRSIAEAMQPVVLTDGMGQVYGVWVIEALEEEQSVFFPDGSFRKQEFTVGLGYYGDDEDLSNVLSDLVWDWL